MSEYTLKTGKVGEKVVGAYKKVEETFTDAFLEKGEQTAGTYTLKTGGVAKKVVDGFKAIENGVVGGYQAIENGVVGGYKKIESKFVDAFLEKVEDESADK